MNPDELWEAFDVNASKGTRNELNKYHSLKNAYKQSPELIDEKFIQATSLNLCPPNKFH